MELYKPTLNPFAVAYVPLAKRDPQDVDKDCKKIPRETADVDLKSKDRSANAANGTRAEIPLQMDSNFVDEESEMDLAYLQMMFPGVSDQSLADVYSFNMGDLEAAIDMLSELESADDQVAELNDKALEPVSSGGFPSVKVAAVAGESSTSPGSSGVTVATS